MAALSPLRYLGIVAILEDVSKSYWDRIAQAPR